MNPFQSTEISWDDPILHICSFLPGKDLLNLSEVDKSFNKIITESKATMAKIRLVVKVGPNDLHLENIIELAEKRQFAAVKLVGINETLAQQVQHTKLLNSLGTIEDIIIEKCKLNKNQFHDIIQAVLPRLKKCEVKQVKLTNNEGGKNLGKPLERSDTNHPLEHLTIVKSFVGSLLMFFVGCKRLKSFEHNKVLRGPSSYLEMLINFLAQQAHLKKLEFYCLGFDWSRMTFFQLEVLTTSYVHWDDSAEEFLKFLKKLTSLKKLFINTHDRLSRHLLEVICSASKLELLGISVVSQLGTPPQAVTDVLVTPDGLFNNTVKKLIIYDEVGFTVTGCLLKIFRRVESVDLILLSETFDLSDVPYETIEKIERISGKPFHVMFRPTIVLERFESVLLGFAEKFSIKVHGITIGNSNFRLSNSFCERLVNSLPQLKALELFNVADRASLEAFLTANRVDLTNFKLHEPFEDEVDFLNKLMNIELN